jgi:hypothetical protein
MSTYPVLETLPKLPNTLKLFMLLLTLLTGCKNEAKHVTNYPFFLETKGPFTLGEVLKTEGVV